jgi:hypothetical protein
VSVNDPRPVSTAALKSLTGVGAVGAAGTASGYPTEFVGAVHSVPAQAVATPLTAEAVVGSVRGVPPPVVNCVEVTVTFHPLPEPVASMVLSGTV